ncbi:MAG: glycoside hydrolase family 57 protein [Prolixibacteraceae bacterium]
MRAVCFNFQVHQPFRFRRYRFFDIGNDHYYYDDFTNETVMRKAADQSYLPVNTLLLKLIKKFPDRFKVSFSISGIAMEQFRLYAPEVLESFKELAGTGQVEFLSETYSHSMAALKNKELFAQQVRKHDDLIMNWFGQKPQVFANTELIYSDEIGAMVASMGFKAMLAEGAKHVLGWKSPNYLYCNAINPRLKVLMRNFRLSDDIAFRFSNQSWNEYPLTARKFTKWLNSNPNDEIINLFMNYEALGKLQPESTGIFRFIEELPGEILRDKGLKFATPSEIAEEYQPIAAVSVPNATSWADEERDLTAWLGNEMQQEAFNKLYEMHDRMKRVDDEALIKDWDALQVSDHFYYMCTKFFSDGEVHTYFNPYESPYEAFINYMNVLSDFKIRLNSVAPESHVDQEIAALTRLLEEKDERLKKYAIEIKSLQMRKKKKIHLPGKVEALKQERRG